MFNILYGKSDLPTDNNYLWRLCETLDSLKLIIFFYLLLSEIEFIVSISQECKLIITGLSLTFLCIYQILNKWNSHILEKISTVSNLSKLYLNQDILITGVFSSKFMWNPTISILNMLYLPYFLKGSMGDLK